MCRCLHKTPADIALPHNRTCLQSAHDKFSCLCCCLLARSAIGACPLVVLDPVGTGLESFVQWAGSLPRHYVYTWFAVAPDDTPYAFYFGKGCNGIGDGTVLSAMYFVIAGGAVHARGRCSYEYTASQVNDSITVAVHVHALVVCWHSGNCMCTGCHCCRHQLQQRWSCGTCARPVSPPSSAPSSALSLLPGGAMASGEH